MLGTDLRDLDLAEQCIGSARTSEAKGTNFSFR
jgi:hypothetical protein